MACFPGAPLYIPPFKRGLKLVNSLGDGYTMFLSWNKAYVSDVSYSLMYNIYYSTLEDNMINEGPKFICLNLSEAKTNIVDFIPGDTNFFVVRASQFDPSWFNPAQLPIDPSQPDSFLRLIPETLLSQDITDSELTVPITDIDIFPDYGIVQVGYELIRYSSKNIFNSELIVSERGFLGTNAREHTTEGFDGYVETSPIIKFWKGLEEENLFIQQKQNGFSANRYGVYTVSDGYRGTNQVGTIVDDSAANDADRIDFPGYDFVGWHRTDPSLFFKGYCVDSYIGGEMFCADGYNGINRQIRNMSFEDQASRLQEMLLDDMGTGSPVVLLKRMWSGITCRCMTNNEQIPDRRCRFCYGTGIVQGYKQFFNPRRSDGRILVRFGPVTEDIKREESGIESYLVHDCWTLTSPKLNDSDVIIKYRQDGTEEWRYEILDVTQNVLLNNASGVQKFRAQRVRKTDIIYQINRITDTSSFPSKLLTNVGILRGPNNIPIPHTHEIVINEHITDISQINQMTSVSTGHNHSVVNGQIMDDDGGLGHTHTIILP